MPSGLEPPPDVRLHHHHCPQFPLLPEKTDARLPAVRLANPLRVLAAPQQVVSRRLRPPGSSVNQLEDGLGGDGQQRKVVVLCEPFLGLDDGLDFLPPLEAGLLELEEGLAFVLAPEINYPKGDVVLLFRLRLLSDELRELLLPLLDSHQRLYVIVGLVDHRQLALTLAALQFGEDGFVQLVD